MNKTQKAFGCFCDTEILYYPLFLVDIYVTFCCPVYILCLCYTLLPFSFFYVSLCYSTSLFPNLLLCILCASVFFSAALFVVYVCVTPLLPFPLVYVSFCCVSISHSSALYLVFLSVSFSVALGCSLRLFRTTDLALVCDSISHWCMTPFLCRNICSLRLFRATDLALVFLCPTLWLLSLWHSVPIALIRVCFTFLYIGLLYGEIHSVIGVSLSLSLTQPIFI